jgi:IS605 OrfB family transposase
VKLTLQLQILPDAEQRRRLLETMERANEAATFAAQCGFKAKVFSQPSIQKLAYRAIRSQFGLSAQMAVRAIGKAVECFARDKAVCPVFKPHGAITYDERIFSFKGVDKVSLWALPEGRVILPMVYGEYQKERFDRIKGQADLVYRKGRFYLYCTVEVPAGSAIQPSDFLGVDLGIANIASDSDGRRHSGSQVKSVRHRHRRLRRTLQKKQTRAAKRRLKLLSGQERRFAAWVNHNISKQIVAEAERSGRGIAIEELNGIRERVKAGRKQRVVLHSWAFSQLRLFLEYKAKLAGIVLAAVDPHNTSRTCSRCGHCEKNNRPNQSEFRCRACGHEAHADINAAENIRRAACKPAVLSELCKVSHGSVKSRRLEATVVYAF